MTISKKLTSKSGITIPKHVRAEAGFTPGMAVDIETTSGGVLIRKRVPACCFCGRTDGVAVIARMEICPACASALKKEIEQHGM